MEFKGISQATAEKVNLVLLPKSLGNCLFGTTDKTVYLSPSPGLAVRTVSQARDRIESRSRDLLCSVRHWKPDLTDVTCRPEPVGILGTRWGSPRVHGRYGEPTTLHNAFSASMFTMSCCALSPAPLQPAWLQCRLQRSLSRHLAISPLHHMTLPKLDHRMIWQTLTRCAAATLKSCCR